MTPTDRLILDAGTGIRPLGTRLLTGGDHAAVHHVMLSHFHWDHIQGIPYFAPLFDARHEVVFHAAAPPDEIRAALQRQMASPFFPIGWDRLPASVRYASLPPEGTEVAGATVRPVALRHPQGAIGFRIDAGEGTLLYASDHEAGEPEIEAGLREAARGVGVLVYDAPYTPREYEERRGWGHSSWEHAAELAEFAGVGRLALFHHDPDHDDEALSMIERAARRRFAATRMAREGDVWEIGGRRAPANGEQDSGRPSRRPPE